MPIAPISPKMKKILSDSNEGRKLVQEIIESNPDKVNMKAVQKDDTLIQICACYSFEHQVIFWWSEEDKMLYAHFHLHTRDNFFKKLWIGLKFAFGRKCRFGAWDEFIFDEKNLKRLYKFLNNRNNIKTKKRLIKRKY